MNPKRGSAESAIQSIGAPRSIPDITFIEIDAVFVQQLAIFFLKCASAMMLFCAPFTDGTRISPLPLPKGEDEGEGLFFCRSSSVNQIACNTLSSSWRN
jgi:hypothetical protein